MQWHIPTMPKSGTVSEAKVETLGQHFIIILIIWSVGTNSEK